VKDQTPGKGGRGNRGCSMGSLVLRAGRRGGRTGCSLSGCGGSCRSGESAVGGGRGGGWGGRRSILGGGFRRGEGGGCLS
jgi:hypothetical protein